MKSSLELNVHVVDEHQVLNEVFAAHDSLERRVKSVFSQVFGGTDPLIVPPPSFARLRRCQGDVHPRRIFRRSVTRHRTAT
jgi:hypothetical protein